MPRILFSTVFRLGNNSSSNGVDKVILNRVVQRGTDYKLDTCDDISLRFDLLGPKLSLIHIYRVSHGLQTLLSYTWGQSIDDVSTDANFLNAPSSNPSTERGPSDYDIRQTFSGAVSYNIPGPSDGVLKQVFGNWSTDTIIYVRSAPPVNVVTGKVLPGTFTSGANSVQRPDVVPGVPFYLYPSGAPGGKIINSAAFTAPVEATAQGDLGRNALRGFGATQWDITLRRQFLFTERVSLQLDVYKRQLMSSASITAGAAHTFSIR